MHHPESNRTRCLANRKIREKQAPNQRLRRLRGIHLLGHRAPMHWCRPVVIVAGLLLAASACAADGARIERIDSLTLRIGEVSVEERDGVLQVRGVLEKHALGRVAQRRAGRFPIRGHLHLLAIGADAQVLACKTTDDFARSARSGVESFSETLAATAAATRLRLIYHEADDQRPVHRQC